MIVQKLVSLGVTPEAADEISQTCTDSTIDHLLEATKTYMFRKASEVAYQTADYITQSKALGMNDMFVQGMKENTEDESELVYSREVLEWALEAISASAYDEKKKLVKIIVYWRVNYNNAHIILIILEVCQYPIKYACLAHEKSHL